MNKIPFFQVDAFTTNVFGGNPAAVCVLAEWLPDAVMQKIAMENNLAETAFFAPSNKTGYDYHLRWFTPKVEVDLCGHATLGTAYVLFEELGFTGKDIRFDSRSGLLTVQKTARGLTLNFPEIAYTESQRDIPRLEKLTGLKVKTVLKNDDIYAVLDETPQTLKNYVPDLAAIKALQDTFLGLIVTACGEDGVDFVSRLFAPQIGIDEDPVTGAIHCVLTPYWSSVLRKNAMQARQLSSREGDLFVERKDGRVLISGEAVLYLKGDIYVP